MCSRITKLNYNIRMEFMETREAKVSGCRHCFVECNNPLHLVGCQKVARAVTTSDIDLVTEALRLPVSDKKSDKETEE